MCMCVCACTDMYIIYMCVGVMPVVSAVSVCGNGGGEG